MKVTDSLERNLAVKCSQGKNKRQDQQSTQQTATTQTRQTRQDKTTLGTPASQEKTKTRQNTQRTTLGTPGALSKERGSKLVCSASTGCGKA